MTPAGLAAAVALVAVAVAALRRATTEARSARAVAARLAGIHPASGAAGGGGTHVLRVAVAGAAVGLVAGAGAGVASLVALLVLPDAVRRWRAAASVGALADALPDVVDAVAASLRAGAPPTAALEQGAAAAPPRLAEGLRTAARSVERGVPLTVAVDSWAASAAVDGAELVATALAVTNAAGGDPARSLAGVADTLRERRALRREVRALSSQARLSAAVIGAAPVLFAVVAAGTDGRTAAVLLGSPLGAACLVAGLGLDVAGWWWMDRITRSPA